MHVDGVVVTTWTSSGNFLGFESIDLSGTSGQVVVVTGLLADLEWFRINEVRLSNFTKATARHRCLILLLSTFPICFIGRVDIAVGPLHMNATRSDHLKVVDNMLTFTEHQNVYQLSMLSMFAATKTSKAMCWSCQTTTSAGCLDPCTCR